ncbi:hypothetical protein [Agrobacterium larrymoorei]|uniref:Uncharacterized protein n=1 Tax=Agrobacterium larrymoorei TaxID=160699 RepID=A0AAF0HEV9_9HYPH|nr:hypothetical protein [Agrobacterium larrymoorei]WHA43233.1 hypothetical protein CFBP5477_018465 [Agrobacterium larrymoorei]
MATSAAISVQRTPCVIGASEITVGITISRITAHIGQTVSVVAKSACFVSLVDVIATIT